MSRRFVIVILALAGLAAGAYWMPHINPYFASSPKISRGQVRQIVEECLKQRQFITRSFFVDEMFIYQGSALEYLMSTFGVRPVIDSGRADRLPLSYWQFEYYRNMPKDQQRELFRVRVSPSGTLLGFAHILPDSAAGDTLSADAAMQLAQQALRTWPDIRFADFKLEQSSSTKKTSVPIIS